MMRGQTPRRACGSRNVCRMDEHAQHDPIGSNPALPFAPVDLFSPIVAAFSACFGRCDGWGVQDADGRLRVAIQRLSRPYSAHWRNIFWTHAPLPLVRWGSRRALTIARRSLSVGRPPLGDGVMTSGAMAARCASDRSIAYLDRCARRGRRDCSSSERHGRRYDTTHPVF